MPLLRTGQAGSSSAASVPQPGQYVPNTFGNPMQGHNPAPPALSPIVESMHGQSTLPTPAATGTVDGYYGKDGAWYPAAPYGQDGSSFTPPPQYLPHQNTPFASAWQQNPYTPNDFGMPNPMAAMQAPPANQMFTMTQQQLLDLIGAATKTAIAAYASNNQTGQESSGMPRRKNVTASDFSERFNGRNVTAQTLEDWQWATNQVYASNGWVGHADFDRHALDTLHHALTGDALSWFREESKRGRIVSGKTTLEEVMQKMTAHFMPIPSEEQAWQEFSKNFGHQSWSKPLALLNKFRIYETQVNVGKTELVSTLINSLSPKGLAGEVRRVLIQEQARLRAEQPRKELDLEHAYRLIASNCNTQSANGSGEAQSNSRSQGSGQASNNRGQRHNPGRDGGHAGPSHAPVEADNRPNDPMELGALDGELYSLLSKHLGLSETDLQKRKKDKKCIYCGEDYSAEHFKQCEKKKEFRDKHPDSGKASGGRRDRPPHNRHKRN